MLHNIAKLHRIRYIVMVVVIALAYVSISSAGPLSNYSSKPLRMWGGSTTYLQPGISDVGPYQFTVEAGSWDLWWLFKKYPKMAGQIEYIGDNQTNCHDGAGDAGTANVYCNRGPN